MCAGGKRPRPVRLNEYWKARGRVCVCRGRRALRGQECQREWERKREQCSLAPVTNPPNAAQHATATVNRLSPGSNNSARPPVYSSGAAGEDETVQNASRSEEVGVTVSMGRQLDLALAVLSRCGSGSRRARLARCDKG